jgi:hypothetical protein
MNYFCVSPALNAEYTETSNGWVLLEVCGGSVKITTPFSLAIFKASVKDGYHGYP